MLLSSVPASPESYIFVLKMKEKIKMRLIKWLLNKWVSGTNRVNIYLLIVKIHPKKKKKKFRLNQERRN
jgi:hypothetical protein